MNLYDIGDTVKCSGVFKNSTGAAQDPASVFFKVKNPSGTITTYTYGVDIALVKSSTGNYYVNIDATEYGQWSYRFYATGSGKSAGEEIFGVRRSSF